jgi:hypothetical protein
MKRKTTILAAIMCLAPAARGAVPAAQAQRKELREGLKDSERRLKLVTLDQHKELLLVREREKADLDAVKASALGPESLHAAILEVHERRRRERLDLRRRGRDARSRLRRIIKDERERVVALRRKK